MGFFLELAQWVKCLLHSYEDLNLKTQKPHKRAGCSSECLQPGETEAQGFLRPASQTV